MDVSDRYYRHHVEAMLGNYDRLYAFDPEAPASTEDDIANANALLLVAQAQAEALGITMDDPDWVE